ncbi:MAG: class I SAM-dependent methyltransferase [Ectothiorhodospiraceae bacterium]
MSESHAEARAFDINAAGAFAEKAADIINTGAVAVMMSIGHRTGLFDTLAALPPSTSEGIARAAGLDERYVREWLAVMVMGGIVNYDPVGSLYELPSEHGASLTRDAQLGNIAVYAQTVALMGAVQEPILERFATGAGMSYGDYPCFHEFMAEDSGQTVVPQLVDTILPLAEGLVDRLRAGIDALDAGCGRGQALIAMAEHFPASRFVGYDLCEDAVDYASRTARSKGLGNIRFEVRDLTHFDEAERYDLVTSFDAVHDQKDPQDLLRRLYRSLRRDGVYLMQDIGGSARLENNHEFPMAALLYAVSCIHCTPVSLAQGGEGLGTMWGWETAQGMLSQAGFDGIERNMLPHDPMNVWFVARRPGA